MTRKRRWKIYENDERSRNALQYVAPLTAEIDLDKERIDPENAAIRVCFALHGTGGKREVRDEKKELYNRQG